METIELHRRRLIDHIQLVVADLAASRRFYEALFDVMRRSCSIPTATISRPCTMAKREEACLRSRSASNVELLGWEKPFDDDQ